MYSAYIYQNDATTPDIVCFFRFTTEPIFENHPDGWVATEVWIETEGTTSANRVVVTLLSVQQQDTLELITTSLSQNNRAVLIKGNFTA